MSLSAVDGSKTPDPPIFGHPTRLHLRLPRFTCENPGCEVTVFRQRLACDKTPVSAVATAVGVSWNVVNSLALSTVKHLVHAQPRHLDRVRVLGVDEHTWKHVRGQGDPSFVTVIVDLTPVVDGTGPARLLDMVPGPHHCCIRELAPRA